MPFVKPIAIVQSMMGIVSAFALRARAVAPPILHAVFHRETRQQRTA
jgi:hypothetical protein